MSEVQTYREIRDLQDNLRALTLRVTEMAAAVARLVDAIAEVQDNLDTHEETRHGVHGL